MKSVLPAVVLFSAAGAVSGCVVVDSQAHIVREEKRFAVSGTPDVALATFDGAIEIHAGDAKSVLVEIEKRGPTKEALDQLRVEARQDGDRVEIDVKRPRREVAMFGIGSSPTAKLIVTMPRQGNITARSGDGAIRIDEIHGRLDLRTGDGSIRGRDVGGVLALHTGDGSVTLDSVDGDLDVDTGDGSVSVSGKPGLLKLHTSDGSITFRADAGTAMTGDWSMTTGDGSVSVYLPPDFAAEIDAHTGDGGIRNDLRLTGEGGTARSQLRGRLGAGGKTLKIRTGDGSIRLKSS